MRRALLFGSMLLALGGCTVYGQYWTAPGATEAAFQAAASNCEDVAWTRFPPMTMGVPGYFRTPNEFCAPTAAGTNCTIVGTGYLPQVQSSSDTNLVPRDRTFDACMVAGGWSPVYQAAGGAFIAGPGVSASAGPGARAAPGMRGAPGMREEPSVRESAVRESAVGQALRDCETAVKRSHDTGRASADFDQCVMTRGRELSGSRPPA